MLFDDVVAAEPQEVIPVAELVLGVAPARLALVRPDVSLIPEDTAPDDIADTYWFLHTQKRSAWTFELDIRPFLEPISNL